MLGNLLRPELEELIRDKQWDVLRDALSHFHPADIAEILIETPEADDVPIFRVLPRDLAGSVFAYLPTQHQELLIRSVSNEQMRSLLKEMTPDDQTRVLEELPPSVTRRILESLSPEELQSARDLLGYPIATAGRYMTPEYVAIRDDMTVREAIDHVRHTGRAAETVYVLYVLDEQGKLQKDIRLGSLVMANPDALVRDIHEGSMVALQATTPKDEVLRTFEKYDRIALPVIDRDGHMLGIITIDDILDVASRQATKEIQKIGGMEALDRPYLDVGYALMCKKRGVWLSVLFLGEMLTATAMGHYEKAIMAAPVLAMFVPLIISSGGNSGSQATTLIIRALALGEVTLHQWWTVLSSELRTSFTLGAWLGMIGYLRIVAWQHLGWFDYGPHYLLVATTVWLSLIGVVCFGSITGSMLPFLLRRLGFDPATSSAPFVATLVDVTGLVIFFSVAMVILRGTLL